MQKFYFIGGPREGQAEEFFRRLGQVGGSPRGWEIYPHAARDGKALHVVEAGSKEEILDHLGHFAGIYERTEIVEIVERP
jgi:hypothetical protein